MFKIFTLSSILVVIASAYMDLGARGPLYDISEPDEMSVIENKAKDLNKTKIINEAKRSLQERLIANNSVYDCEKNKTRRFTPSIELKEDLVLPTGEVLYKKGYRFNPLTLIPHFPESTIFINAKDSNQTKFAKNGNYTLVFVSDGNVTLAQKNTSKQAYPADKNLIDSFNLQCSPSSFLKQGDSFIIKEYAPTQLFKMEK